MKRHIIVFAALVAGQGITIQTTSTDDRQEAIDTAAERVLEGCGLIETDKVQDFGVSLSLEGEDQPRLYNLTEKDGLITEAIAKSKVAASF